MKDPYSKNYITLMKDVENDTDKWKAVLPMDWKNYYYYYYYYIFCVKKYYLWKKYYYIIFVKSKSRTLFSCLVRNWVTWSHCLKKCGSCLRLWWFPRLFVNKTHWSPDSDTSSAIHNENSKRNTFFHLNSSIKNVTHSSLKIQSCLNKQWILCRFSSGSF